MTTETYLPKPTFGSTDFKQNSWQNTSMVLEPERHILELWRVPTTPTGHRLNVNWKLVYRSTPYPSTKFAPFQLLFGRGPRTKQLKLNCMNAKSAKANAKQYADGQNKAKAKDFKVGYKVLVKSKKGKQAGLQLHMNLSHMSSRQRRDRCLHKLHRGWS